MPRIGLEGQDSAGTRINLCKMAMNKFRQEVLRRRFLTLSALPFNTSSGNNGSLASFKMNDT